MPIHSGDQGSSTIGLKGRPTEKMVVPKAQRMLVTVSHTDDYKMHSAIVPISLFHLLRAHSLILVNPKRC